MKLRQIYPLLAGALLLGSCSSIDPTQKLNEYTDCIVYSHDTTTDTGILTNFSSIEVTGDMSTGYYSLNFNDFQLTEGEALRSATVSGLIQFMDDVSDENGNLQEVHYTFFTQNEGSRQNGDMDISDMQFSWLSTIYWLNMKADAGRYAIWSLPSRVSLYANRNLIKGPYGDNNENAISPRYDMTFDVMNKIITLKTTGVKYPVDSSDPSKSLEIRAMTWDKIPITLNEKGFTARVDEFNPTINGTTDEYTISNFNMTYETAYEGTRSVSFSLTSKSTGLKLFIITHFDYYIEQHF